MLSKSALLGALLLALTHCASGIADPKAPPATATVELLSISPVAGSAVDERTVLVAELRYSIEHFQPHADDYLAPLFDSTEGPGRSFNAFDRIDEGTRLTGPAGTVTIRYGIARELRSPKLARPIRVSYLLMERTGEHTTRGIGSAGPVEYR